MYTSLVVRPIGLAPYWGRHVLARVDGGRRSFDINVRIHGNRKVANKCKEMNRTQEYKEIEAAMAMLQTPGGVEALSRGQQRREQRRARED